MQILKKNLFGIDFDIEFDFYGPIFKAWQKVYEFRLKNAWNRENYINPKQSLAFIKFALTHLPNGSFIIFYFDSTNEKFVQFANFGSNIQMDIPVWSTNIFYEKKTEIYEALAEAGIKKTAITEVKEEDENFDIKVPFGTHFGKAAQTTFLIAKRIFGINEPCVFEYTTSNLVSKK